VVGEVLRGAHLEGAYLIEGHLEGADLIEAHLERADLSGAHLEGAYLSGAHLSPDTSFQLATLRGASWKEVNLSILTLSEDQLNSTFGDASVKPPNGLTRPKFWPDTKLDLADFYEELGLWRSNPAAYISPQDR